MKELMKKFFNILAILFAVSCVSFGFIACDNADDENSENSGNSENNGENTETSFTISFDTGNFAVKASNDQTRTSVSSVKKNKGDNFAETDIPGFIVRTGYKFAGWYFDSDYTKPFASFSVTEDVRLYGKFITEDDKEIKTYLVTYVSEGSTHKPVTTDKYIYLPTLPDSNGCEKLFTGWFYDKNYTHSANFGDTISEDTTLYANWTPWSAITNAGSGATFEGHEYVSIVDWYTRTAEKNPESSEYDYTKASQFTSGTDKVRYFVAPGLWQFENTVLYSSNFNRMNVNAKSGKMESLYMQSHSEKARRTSVPETVGAKVDMQKLDAFVAVKATEAGIVTASINTADGASYPTGCTALVDESGTVLAAQKNQTGDARKCTLTATVMKAGNVYLVTSRNDDTNGGINVYSIEFKAGAAETYTVTLQSENLVYKTITVTEDTPLSLPTPTASGKIFAGWYYNRQYTIRASNGDTISQNMTLFAKWISLSEIDAGSGATFEGHEYVSSIDWYTKSESNEYTKVTEFKNDTSSINYYISGLWKFDGVVLYTSKFDPIMAKVSKNSTTIKNLYVRSYTKNDMPVAVGEKIDLTKMEAFIAVKAGAGETVVASIYTADSSDTARANGMTALVDETGTILAVQKNQTGDARDCTLAAKVTKAGNVFLVYLRNGDTSDGGYVSSIKSGKAYTVTFKSEYGEHSPIAVMDGDTLTLPTPSSDEKLFAGWYYDAGYTRLAKDGDTISEDTTLYAKWVDESTSSGDDSTEADVSGSTYRGTLKKNEETMYVSVEFYNEKVFVFCTYKDENYSGECQTVKGTYTISDSYIYLLGTFFEDETESKLEFAQSDDWKVLIIKDGEMTGELTRQ